MGWKEQNIYVWEKTNPLPLFGNNNFLQAAELALVLAKGKPQFRFRKGRQPLNRFESPQVGGTERLKRHDGSAANLAQKPLVLNSLWIMWASKPGDWVLDAFTAENIGIGVHYIPVHLHPFYRSTFGWQKGAFPNAEWIAERTLSLPLSPALNDDDVQDVIDAFQKVLTA